MSITPTQFAECIIDTIKKFPLEMEMYNPTAGSDDINYRWFKHNQIMPIYNFSESRNLTLLYNQLEKVGIWLIQQQDILVEPIPMNLGCHALFYQSGENGVRLQPSYVQRLPTIIMLPAVHSSYSKENHSTVEIVDIVDQTRNTYEDVEALVRYAADVENLEYRDAKVQNQGLYKWPHLDEPIQVVIDPGCLIKKFRPK